VLDGGQVAYAVVMELAEGGTVADVVQRDGAWPEARAVAEVARLLGAIDKLHGCGALHRDITPYNVFACGDADRAQARRLRPHHPRAAQGVAADAFPPWFVDRAIREEQAHALGRARGPLGRSPQVLAVLLTGKVEPVRAADIRTLRCSKATRAVLARAIGDRANRFDSARAMAEALKGRAKEAAPARPSRPRSPGGSQRRVHRSPRHPPRDGRVARPQGRRERVDHGHGPDRPAGRRHLAPVDRGRRGRPQAARGRGQARERPTHRPHHRGVVPAPRRSALSEIKDALGNTTTKSLLELGFMPSFYHFSESEIEVRMTIQIQLGEDMRAKVTGSPIELEYHRKHQFDVNGSSLIRTKMITVPAPALFLDLLREQAKLGGTISQPGGGSGGGGPQGDAPEPESGADGDAPDGDQGTP
jgi:hypothetical protein